MKYYIGCCGFKNNENLKDFYPSHLDSKYFLSYYSKIFNFVYIDFNASPIPISHTTIRRWYDETPDDFRFSIKIPQYVLENKYEEKIQGFSKFLKSLTLLKNKILCIVLSPPKLISLKENGLIWLETILNECNYYGYHVVFDFNHFSWYQDLTYNTLKKYNSSFVWFDSGYKYYYPAITANFVFLKLSKNSSNKNNNKTKWIELIKQKEKEFFFLDGKDKRLEFATIVINSHLDLNPVLDLLDLKEKKPYISANSSTKTWTGKMIMHIDMNAFFPACEEIRDPSLKGKPHAVIMTPEPEGKITRGAVASCSYEARKYGVRSAMSLLKAKELCPHLVVKPVDKQYYSIMSNKVMMLLEEYADVLEKASIDEAYIDCTNKIQQYQQQSKSQNTTTTTNNVFFDTKSTYKDKDDKTLESISISKTQDSLSVVEEYAIKIKKSISEQCNGLVCSIGVAPTKSAAKIASDFKKPDGLTIVYPQNLLQFLEPLEVNIISGIGSKTNQILNEMGIKTIGQLAKCNVQNLIERFGKKNGLWMWYVANGKDNEPVSPREDSLSISIEKTLLQPSKHKKIILDYLVNELSDDVFDRVRKRGYAFKTIGIKLVRTNFVVETRETTLSSYSSNKKTIVSAMEPLLEKFHLNETNVDNNSTNELDAVFIRKLGIKLSNLSKMDNKKLSYQKTLFDYIDKHTFT